MKQTRRKELKTNELSIYLQQIRDTAIQNSNYIIGGLVVVVIILIVGLSVQRSRVKAEADRWLEFTNIQNAMSQGSGDPMDRAKALADLTTSDKKLGPRALDLYGDMLREKAMSISPTDQAPERAQLLEQAKSAYEKLIQTYSSQSEVVLEARMKLAALAETQYVDGKGDIEPARQQYQEVLKNPNNAFATAAQQQLDSLAKRTKRLQIVASRPAESAPAAAATTQPASKMTVKKLPQQLGPRVTPTTAPTAK